MFSETVMKAISTLNKEVNLLDHQRDLRMMTETNWNTEQRKGGERSKETIMMHTATGLGAEIALHSTGLFTPTSEITKNAEGLSFQQRKRDVLCEEKIGEVKTMSGKYPNWYISKDQRESIMYCTQFNEFFIVVSYEQLQPLKYRYRPRFLIDSKAMARYIIKGTGKSAYMFDHKKAIAADGCKDLWSVA
jgi:hypothetical protein